MQLCNYNYTPSGRKKQEEKRKKFARGGNKGDKDGKAVICNKAVIRNMAAIWAITKGYYGVPPQPAGKQSYSTTGPRGRQHRQALHLRGRIGIG